MCTYECPQDGEIESSLVLVAPSLADLLESDENDDASESDTRGRSVGLRQQSEDVVDRMGRAIANAILTKKRVDLTQADDNGRCGDEAVEDRS